MSVERLTSAAFAPFGEVIEAGPATPHFTINGGRAERYHTLAPIDACRDGGQPWVSIFRTQPSALPLCLTMVERHGLGSQAFMPLSGRPWLVVVAPAGPPPASAALRCFLATGHQGVNYRAGTWHHPLLALESPSDFIVIDRSPLGGAVDCDTVQFAERVWVMATMADGEVGP